MIFFHSALNLAFATFKNRNGDVHVHTCKGHKHCNKIVRGSVQGLALTYAQKYAKPTLHTQLSQPLSLHLRAERSTLHANIPWELEPVSGRA